MCDLAEELRRHDLRLGVNVKLKTLKIFLQIDSQRRDVLIEEPDEDRAARADGG
ncbi:hypothetical protein G5V59_20040 [Nocardioides sp. W3-2-3]|nr:hypothetical protein [Nocardioides convexus]